PLHVFETVSYYDIGDQILAATTDNASSIDVFGHIFGQILWDNCNN
ncbi:24561_t:CDS:1, partial [Gigaspora rosea]